MHNTSIMNVLQSCSGRLLHGVRDTGPLKQGCAVHQAHGNDWRAQWQAAHAKQCRDGACSLSRAEHLSSAGWWRQLLNSLGNNCASQLRGPRRSKSEIRTTTLYTCNVEAAGPALAVCLGKLRTLGTLHPAANLLPCASPLPATPTAGPPDTPGPRGALQPLRRSSPPS